jgi:hypothetical protein
VILETIVTTISGEGRINVAPMGVTPAQGHFLLKPYRETTTYRNLLEVTSAVIHLVDDAAVYARSALGAYDGEYLPTARVRGAVLANACSWTEVEVAEVDDAAERVVFSCRVVHTGRLRDFIGFNRARNAILEATILATRVRFLPLDQIWADLQKLEVIVGKCGDPHEVETMAFVLNHVRGCRV